MKRLRHITGLIVTFLLVLPCHAGWVISEQITDNFGNSTIQTTFIQQNQIRFESTSSISILDLNHQLITIIFPNLRAYWQGSPTDLTNSMIEAYDSQVQMLVLSLPYDQQEEFQQMYDSIKMKMLHPDTIRTSQDIVLTKTDSIKEINGFLARKYLIARDSITRERIWITTDIKPYGELDTKLFVEMSNQINPYSKKGFTLNTDEYLDLLSNGLILKSVKIGQMEDHIVSKVTNVKQVNIPSDFFLPPVNYHKVSLADAFTLPVIEPSLDDE